MRRFRLFLGQFTIRFSFLPLLLYVMVVGACWGGGRRGAGRFRGWILRTLSEGFVWLGLLPKSTYIPNKFASINFCGSGSGFFKPRSRSEQNII